LRAKGKRQGNNDDLYGSVTQGTDPAIGIGVSVGARALSVIAATLSYTADDGAKVATYLARPEGAGPYPALVMGYEFWGMLEVPGGGPHMRDVAGRFAEAGYVAAVPDYYAARGQQPTMEGGTIKGAPSDEQSGRDLEACVRWLAALPYVAGDRLGTIGWCGGGRQALFLAGRSGSIRAAASFYGRPVNRPNQPRPGPIDVVGSIRCPVFGAYGEDDKAIPVETVREFEAALELAGVPHEIHYYRGAGHAFMNDQRDSYYAPAARESWQSVLAFFDRHVGKGAAG
jgi:carboxymethylenebutenolidase